MTASPLHPIVIWFGRVGDMILLAEAHKRFGAGRRWQASRKSPMRAFAWFLGLCAAALFGVAVFAYPAWALLYPHFNFPFHRVGERIGMLALLVGFLALARYLGLADRRSLGYGLPRRAFLREMSLAVSTGAARMAAAVGRLRGLAQLEW